MIYSLLREGVKNPAFFSMEISIRGRGGFREKLRISIKRLKWGIQQLCKLPRKTADLNKIGGGGGGVRQLWIFPYKINAGVIETFPKIMQKHLRSLHDANLEQIYI